jgi:hypothetical protein
MRSIVGVLGLCICGVLTGCLHNRYITPVTSFQSSTTQTISVISDFYSSRNSYEAQLYLADIANDPSLRVETKDASGRPTPLMQSTFSPESIKARLDALALVSVYANRLYDLANTKAPADFETASTALGTNLASLNNRFSTLAGKGDASANAYVGPITSVIGTIGKLYLNGKRDAMVKVGIQDGGPQVNQILSLMRADMDNIFSLEVISGANQQLATDIVAYNSDKGHLTYDQRVARLKVIATAAEVATSATASVPSQLVASMITANNALLKSAASKGRDKQLSLSSLNDALAAWVTQLQTLSAQIAPLIKKG